MKKTIITIVVLGLIGAGMYFYITSKPVTPPPVAKPTVTTATTIKKETAKPVADTTKTVLGKSVANRDIIAYHFGTGSKEILFVGGIHGGYEWNTALVAFELMDYLTANPKIIPANVKVTVIPVLNPDGLMKVTGKEGRFNKADVSKSNDIVVSGRFNANNVDLNRNFDCEWQSKAIWMTETVSGGSKAFSEPESQAFKSYVESHSPTAVVTWYSSAGGVFSSNCKNGVLPETKLLTGLYAKASAYPAYQNFDFYKITGDMPNWLAKNNIPAISILLTTHQDTEWAKNLLGIKAVLNHYAK